VNADDTDYHFVVIGIDGKGAHKKPVWQTGTNCEAIIKQARTNILVVK
jgi:hypothetical protein